MYEVEFKVEIMETEREHLCNLFEKDGFIKKPSVVQNDYYIEAKKSPYGGFDLKRYRKEGEKFFYAEKIWEDINGHKARKEIEREVSEHEFNTEVKRFPNALKIIKTRQSFLGKFEALDIHIDMDSVKFDHSKNMRYFIEAEVISENKENDKELSDLYTELYTLTDSYFNYQALI